jgi:MFS family permease
MTFSETNRSHFVVLVAATLMAVTGVALISPMLPSVREVFGLSDLQASALIWGYLLPGIFLAPFVGYAADRWGRRKILAGSLLLFGSAGALCAVPDSFLVLMTLRVLQGLGGLSLPLMARTLIGDYYEDNQGAYMGYHDAWLSVGGAFFPVLGGFLGGYYWWTPFLIYSTAVPVGLAALFVLPRQTFTTNQPEKPYLTRLANALQEGPMLFLLFGVSLVFVLKYGFQHTALPFLVNDLHGLESGGIGMAVGLMAISAAGIASVHGRLERNFPRIAIVAGGFLCYGTGLFLATVGERALFLEIGILFAGLGHGLLLPALNTAIVGSADKELRASTMSVRKIFVRGGQTLGSPLLAWTGQSWGYATTVMVVGVLVVTSSFFLILKSSLNVN